MSVQDVVEVVSSGTGVVVEPMSTVRLNHRKDVTDWVVTDWPATKIGPGVADRQRGPGRSWLSSVSCAALNMLER